MAIVATSMNGIIVIDKPPGMTSHDVVQCVRRRARERRVGHLGTLDPMATGVLPLLLGKFTRLAQFFGDAEKEYEGTIQFGFATDTFDAEGQPAGAPQSVQFTIEELDSAVHSLTGNIEQVPPTFSAKKVAGVRAYHLARKGTLAALAPVSVRVDELALWPIDRVILEAARPILHNTQCADTGKIMELSNPITPEGARLAVPDEPSAQGVGVKMPKGNVDVNINLNHSVVRPVTYHLRAKVSAGCYIRSLAHDLGKALGCGAHLTALRRTRSGEFTLRKASPLDGPYRFIPPSEVLCAMQSVHATAEQLSKVRHGQTANFLADTARIKIFHEHHLVAIYERVAGSLYRACVVVI